MDRRTFLKTSTAAAAATTAAAGGVHAETALSAPAIIASRHELRIAAPASSHLADAAFELARDIAQASGGRILLAFQPAPISGSAADAIATGHLDGAYGHLTELCAAPELALFEGLPSKMALSPENLLVWHAAAAGDMFLAEALAPFGLTALIAGHTGPETGLWADRPIGDLSEFAAAHIQTLGLGTIIAETHYKTHIRTHHTATVIEHPASPLEALLSVPPPNRSIWYRDGLHQQGFAAALALSQTAWSKLNAGDQLLIEALARSAAHRTLARNTAGNRLVRPGVFARHAVQQTSLPDKVAAAILQTAIDVIYVEMAKTRATSRAFEAYAAFFEAITGAPLPRPAHITSPTETLRFG